MESDSLVKYDTKVLLSSEDRPRSAKESVHSLLPPVVTLEAGEEWAQFVSSKPAVPQDVRRLESKLDKLLRAQKARETGVCPLRELLYEQAFNEVIRQVAINSYDRGRLLIRIRDTNKLTISTYKRLFESSVTFGMRKMLQGQRIAGSRRERIGELQEDCRRLEVDLGRLETEAETLETQEAEKEEARAAVHEREKTLRVERNLEMTIRLEALLQAAKR